MHLRYRLLRRIHTSRLHGPIILVLLACLLSSLAVAQTATAGRKSPTKRRTPAPATAISRPRPSAVAAELQARIDRAAAAQQSGDVNAITSANRSLIGLALRRMGNLRVYQGALPEAAETFRHALDYEDSPDGHVEYGIALLRAKRTDEALHEASEALTRDSNNARAWHLQGKVLMVKRDYKAAVEPLSRSLALQPSAEPAYALAICLLEAKDKARAEAVFKQMLDLGGDRAGFHVLFARAYRDATLMEDAERELRRAIAMDAKSTRAHYFLGLLYMVKNEWSPSPQAIEQFQAEIQLNPRDFFGNYFMGVIRSGEKKFDESDRYLRIASQAKPDWPEPWLYLGLNAASRNEPKAAEPLLRKAIKLTGADEGRNNYQIRRAYYALGRLMIADGRHDEGQQAIAKSRAMQQKTLDESHQKLAGMGAGGAVDAQTIADTPRDDAAAQVTEKGQLSSDPLEHANLTDAEKKESLRTEQQLRGILANALNDLGTAEARSQQYDVALIHFQEAKQWNAAMPNLNRNIGMAAARLNRFADAVPALREASSSDPKDNMVRALLGLSLFMTDNYADASKTFAPLGDAVLQDPTLAYAAAASLTRTGDLARGRALLDQLEKHPLPPELSLSVGQTRSEGGDYEGALVSFRRALEGNPALPKAHYYSGLALIRLDRPADAARELRTELSQRPNDVDAKYHLAYALLQLSNKDEALPMLREVIAANPDHAEAHYQLGKALLDEGQLKPAIEQLEIAARLKPQLDYVHYQLQAAYRKDARLAEADRELKLYRELKARNRERTTPQPDEQP